MTSRIALCHATTCVLALAACASQNNQKQADSARTQAPKGHVFEVVRIDDAVDPLADVTDDQLPAGQGMAIYSERSMVSGGKIVQIHFVRTVRRNDETVDAACARFLNWVQTAHIQMPPEHRFACEPLLEYDSNTKTTTPGVGVRSYVLTGSSVITERDVTDAYVGDDKSEDADLLDVGVKLSPQGRAKLKAATADWIHRRLGVLADGMVSDAPLVKGEIDTDTLTIGFGPRSPEELEKAHAFVSRLREK